jgi:hypothetical protein
MLWMVVPVAARLVQMEMVVEMAALTAAGQMAQPQ